MQMKRLIIVCEGHTEVAFCRDVLLPYFSKKNINIQPPLIKKSGGGIVPWSTLKRQIKNHLQEPNVFVSTLIDYYGIPDKFKFPEWEKAKKIINKNDKLDFLESSMKEDIDKNASFRFIPYLQLHEFEGLLFNNIEVFDEQIDPSEFRSREELLKTINSFPNPEMINDDPVNTPAKRLERLIVGYNKIVHGSILAEKIGLERIRKKSPRFNNWIEKLENI